MRELYFKKNGDLAKVEGRGSTYMIEANMFDEKYEYIEKMTILGDYFTSRNLYLTPADINLTTTTNREMGCFKLVDSWSMRRVLSCHLPHLLLRRRQVKTESDK
jgi:hypothetical protein